MTNNKYFSVGGGKSGIAYQRPIITNRITSYRTGDEGWHQSNGTYDYTPPVNPASIAMLADRSFTLLKENNAFGNKNRFTDDLGTQAYASTYIIDHLTGFGWRIGYWTISTSAGWNQAIDDSASYSGNGFTDWRLPSVGDIHTIYQYSVGLYATNYVPFSTMNQSSGTYTSTTTNADSTKFYGHNSVWGAMYTYAKTSSGKYYVCRNHYN